MNIYPDLYLDSILELSVDTLNKNNIKGLMIDIDNTVVDTQKNIIDGLEDWYKKIKEAGIKCIILSNSSKIAKIRSVSDKLEIPYISLALKPLKSGFKRGIKLLDLDRENIAVVGDQIFTDVIGANRCKLFSILVKPINEQDLWYTKWKRPIENKILEKYKKNNEK